MLSVPCPACKIPMGMDENDPQGEWECPECQSSFVVQRNSDGSLHTNLMQPAARQFSAKPMPAETVSTTPEIKDEAYVYALECLMKGMKSNEIRKSLITSGYTGKQVDKIIQTANQYRLNSEANEKFLDGPRGNSGMRNMVVGGLFCVGGLLVTLASFSAARHTGGSYVLAWGAIIFGAIQFARGWNQSNVS